MALYEWAQERDGIGFPDIDEAHKNIARLSQTIVDSYARGATRAEIRQSVCRFADALLRHFDAEEQILASLPPAAVIVEHTERHKANHDYFRNAVFYLMQKFEGEPGRADAPNIIPIIPEQYFAELKGLDAEMGCLAKGNTMNARPAGGGACPDAGGNNENR